jgi:hypothetical protein
VSERYNCVIYSTAPHYGPKPSVVRRSELPSFGYSSLYAITEDSARAIEEAGTTARFAGSVWNERLWLDFDSYEAGRAAEEELNRKGLGYVLYDSGGRGMHFGIRREASPSHLLPYQDKEWAQAHFPSCDPSIYTHLHLFRLPGTIHERTGRRKELVREQAGSVLTLPKWERKNGSRTDINIGDANTDSGGVSVFESNRIMANTVPTRNGERHPTMMKLMYAMKDHGVVAEAAMWYLGEVNKMAETPKTDEELEHILRSVYESKETF